MQIFSLMGEILLKDNGTESKLGKIDKKASGVGKSMGLSFGGIAKSALKVGAVLGAGMGIKDMITKASAGEQKMKQMENVLKSTHGAAGMTKESLLKLAESQGKLTTFSKGTNMETENLMLTFTKIGKDIFPDTLKVVNDMSTALGTDTKSSATMLGKALQDPIKGIGALSRVGVNFTAEQKKTIEGMVKMGDVSGAQKIILKELNTEYGGSAEAIGKTFGGQLTIAKNQVAGMGAMIGTALLPTLTSLITSINNNMPKIKQVISSVVTTVSGKFKEWITIIGQIAKELFPSLGKSVDGTKGKLSGFGNALGLVTKALTLIRDNIGLVRAGLIAYGVALVAQNVKIAIHNALLIKKNIQQAIAIAKDKIETLQIVGLYVAQGIHNGVMIAAAVAQKALNLAMMANPIGIVIALIVALVASIIYLFNHNKKFHDFVINSCKIIKQVVGESIKAIIGFFKELPTKLSSIWNSIKTGVSDLFKSIGAYFVNGWNSIKTNTINAWNGIVSAVIAKVKSLITGITNTFNGLKSGLSNIMNSIKEFLVNVWITIKTAVSNVITGFVNFIKDKFYWQIYFLSDVFTQLQNIFKNAWTIIKNIVLGIVLIFIDLITGSFTKLKTDLSNILNNIKTAFLNIWNSIKQIVVDVAMAIKFLLIDIWNGIVTTSKNIWNSFKTFMSNLWNNIKTTAANVWNGIKATINNIITSTIAGAKNAWNGFKSFLSNLWNSIKTTAINMWNSLKTAIPNLINATINGAKNSWNNFKNFMSNLWNSIKSNTANAWNSLKSTVINLCNSIVNGAKNVWNGLINWFKQLPSTLRSIGANMFNSMRSGVTSTISGVGSAIRNGIGNAVDFLKNLPSEMMGYGRDMIQGMIDGISSMIGSVTSAVSGVGDTIRSYLHFSVPDEGPLTDYESWMPDFMGGMAKGIDNNKFKITDSLKSLTSDMKVNAKISTEGTKDTDLNPTSKKSSGITININGFVNKRKEDVEALMEEMAFVAKKKGLA